MQHGEDYGENCKMAFSVRCSRERSDDYNFQLHYFVVNNKCNWLKSVWLQLKVDFKFCYAEMSEYCCVANEFGILCAQYYRNWSKFVKTTNRVTILFLDHS